MNYPEAIYGTRNGGTMTPKQRDGFGGMTRRYAYNLGYADGWVDRGKSVMPVPAGWSNLTEAIKAGERIDWEQLDGLEAKCVHPEMGTLNHKLVRDQPEPPNSWAGWGDTDSAISHWDTVFECAWQGSSGWSLYIKGDIPLRKLTADQLEPGTCFLDVKGNSHIVYITPRGEKVACARYGSCDKDPKYVYVGKVLGVGTFQTPEGDA